MACGTFLGVHGLFLLGHMGLSSCGMHAPGHEGLVVMHSIWDLSSLTRD